CQPDGRMHRRTALAVEHAQQHDAVGRSQARGDLPFDSECSRSASFGGVAYKPPQAADAIFIFRKEKIGDLKIWMSFADTLSVCLRKRPLCKSPDGASGPPPSNNSRRYRSGVKITFT